MSNVELCGHDVVQLQGDDAGGGSISGGYEPSAVDAALKHLDRGLQLSPQDLSIHMGRLHVLEVAGRFDEMARALDESIGVYKGRENVADTWIVYTSELWDMRLYKGALQLLAVLDKRFPNNHEVLGNMGVMHMVLNECAQALPLLERAAALAPDDVIDVWNVGHVHECLHQNDEAERFYQKALALKFESEAQRKSMSCYYGGFLARYRHDAKRACELERANCEADQQDACAPEPTPKAADKKP